MIRALDGADRRFQPADPQPRPRHEPVVGAVAQLGERRVRNAKVRGSTPLGSTTLRPAGFGWQATRKRILGVGVSAEALA